LNWRTTLEETKLGGKKQIKSMRTEGKERKKNLIVKKENCEERLP